MSMGICHYYLIVFFLILTFIKVSNANHLIPLRPSSSGNRYENIGGFIFSNTGHKNGDQHDRRIAERRNLQSWIDSIYENDRKSYTNYQTQYNSKRSNSPLMESSLDERKVGRIFESILEGLANGSLYLPKTDLGSGVREFFRTLQYVKKSSRETNLQTGEKVSQKVSRKRGPLSLGPIEKKRLKGQGFGTNGDLGLKNGKKLDDVDEDDELPLFSDVYGRSISTGTDTTITSTRTVTTVTTTRTVTTVTTTATVTTVTTTATVTAVTTTASVTTVTTTATVTTVTTTASVTTVTTTRTVTTVTTTAAVTTVTTTATVTTVTTTATVTEVTTTASVTTVTTTATVTTVTTTGTDTTVTTTRTDTTVTSTERGSCLAHIATELCGALERHLQSVGKRKKGQLKNPIAETAPTVMKALSDEILYKFADIPNELPYNGVPPLSSGRLWPTIAEFKRDRQLRQEAREISQLSKGKVNGTRNSGEYGVPPRSRTRKNKRVIGLEKK